MTDYLFCPNCGGSTVRRVVGGRERDACDVCKRTFFVNPAPAAAAVLMEDGRVLLARRASTHFRGRWYIPAGFVEADETVQDACLREAKEETGLDVEIARLFHVNSGFDVPGRPVIGVYYLVRRVGGELTAGSDVDALEWFGLDAVPDLPFGGDREVIDLLRLSSV